MIVTVLAVLVGTGWRAARLDNRPLHADEAVQAWQTWQLLSGQGYQYDPLDRHGPTLYFGSAALHRLKGGTAADYDDRAARRFSLAAGIATLVLLGFGARLAGFPNTAGAFAVAALAFEPLSSLYQTYFVQEASLAFLIWAFLFLLLSPQTKRAGPRLVMLGLLAGLAQATKETTPLYLLLALLSVRLAKPGALRCPDTRSVGLVLVGFIIPFTLFYSSFGTNPAGIIDAFRTYGLQAQRVGSGAHSYPIWHYAKVFGIGAAGPINWCAWAFLGIGFAGFAEALRRRDNFAAQATAWFTLGLIVVHSLIPYKTPWLMLTPVIGLALLAGYLLSLIVGLKSWTWSIALILISVTCFQSARISAFALDRYPGDIRNPYFYEQAPRNLLRVSDRVKQLQQAREFPVHVAVISPEHAWPLPWYLRNQANVGFFEKPPDNLTDWNMVIWDDQMGDPPESLTHFPIAEISSLRPNVMLYTFIDGPTWETVFPILPPTDS